MPKNFLPRQTPKQYSPVHKCIYCGSGKKLSDEHIIPLALGGRWVLPQASCAGCASITSTFEGVCLRPILGPLRLYFDFPTRRPKTRPKKLPLKVKYTSDQNDWTTVEVRQEDYPFLVVLPQYNLPEELGGITTTDHRDSATKTFWVRGGNFGEQNVFLRCCAVDLKCLQLCHRVHVARTSSVLC